MYIFWDSRFSVCYFSHTQRPCCFVFEVCVHIPVLYSWSSVYRLGVSCFVFWCFIYTLAGLALCSASLSTYRGNSCFVLRGLRTYGAILVFCVHDRRFWCFAYMIGDSGVLCTCRQTLVFCVHVGRIWCFVYMMEDFGVLCTCRQILVFYVHAGRFWCFVYMIEDSGVLCT